MSNNATQNLISFDEVINLARLKGVNFGKGDPYNRIRYYIKIGLLPRASRKSFNGLPPAGALPIAVVDKIVEINSQLTQGKSIQAILKESQSPESFSLPSVVETVKPNILDQNLDSVPATAESLPPQTVVIEPQSPTTYHISTLVTNKKTFRETLKSWRNIKFRSPKVMIALGEIFTLLFGGIFIITLTAHNISNKVFPKLSIQTTNLPKANLPNQILGSSIQEGLFSVNVATNLNGLLTASAGIDTQNTNINVGSGKVTASNVIYSITGGQNVSVTPGQNPVISVNAAPVDISGTQNRINVSGSKIDISPNFAGQSSISLVGTITGGTWQATPISATYINAGACNSGEFVQSINGSLNCGTPSVGSTNFDQIGSGTNQNTLVIGNGGTLATTGTGSITATALAGGTYGINITGNADTATNATTADTANNLSGVLGVLHGGTGADLSATGGANQFVRQNSSGSAFTVGAITDTDIPDNITLTNLTQITNRAISDTTGTLAVSRGGTGLASFGGTNTILYTSAANNLASLAANSGSIECLTQSSSGAPAWASCGGISGIAVTDGTTNVSSATKLSFDNFFKVTDNTPIANITIKNSSIGNAQLANTSITINNGGGIAGGAAVSLGNSLTLSVDQAFSPTWTGTHTFTPSGAGNTIFNGDNDSNVQIASIFTGTGPSQSVLDLSLTDNASASGTSYLLNLTNKDNLAAAGVPTALIHLNNANGAETVANGLFIEQTGAGTLTNAIDIKQTSGAITNLVSYDNGTNTAAINIASLSATQTYTLPNASGTFAVGGASGNLGNSLTYASNLFDVKLAPSGGSSTADFSGLQIISGSGLSLLSCNDTQILKKNGTNWTCSTDATGTGSVGGTGTQYTLAMFNDSAGDRVGDSIISQNPSSHQLTIGANPDTVVTDSLLKLGATPLSSGNANGTYIGLNASNTFVGDLVNLQVNNTTQFLVNSSGGITGNSLYLGKAGPSGTTGSLTFANDTNTFTTSFKASSSTTASVIYILPTDKPAANKILQSDNTGVLSWVDNTGGTCSTCIVQDPTATADNTITAPSTSGVIGLTIKGSLTANAKILDIFDSAASPTEQAFFDSSGVLTLNKPLTAPTSSNTINSLVINSGALSSVTGITFGSGAYNFDQSSSSGTFKTGTGAVTLNGSTTLSSGKTLTLAGIGSGLLKATSDVVGLASAGIDYEVPLTFNGGLTRSTNTVSVDQAYSFTLTGNNTFTPSGTNDVTFNLDADSTLAKIFSSATDATSGETFSATNSNAGASSAAINGSDYTLVGTATSGGANTITGIKFENVSAIANNTFNGISFGTGFNNFLSTPTISISAAGAVSGVTGVTFSSGVNNFDQSSSSGTFKTGTGLATIGGSLQVTGTVGIATTPVANIGLKLNNTLTTATIQEGIELSTIYNTAATSSGYGLLVNTSTTATAFTLPIQAGIVVNSPTVGATSAITSNYGILINDQVAGTNNYGIKIGAANTAALLLASDAHTAASGITFGTTSATNLYISAANTLRTDGAFNVGGTANISSAGVITGATGVTSSGTINFTGLSTAGVVTNTSGGQLGTLAGSATTVLHGNSSGTPTYSAVDLTADVSGLLPTTKGGLGANITPAGGGEILYSDSGTTYNHLAHGTALQCLLSGGTGVPTWGNCATGASSPFQTASGVITKITPADEVQLTEAQAGDYGLLVDTSAAPTVDLLQANIVTPTTTDGVDSLSATINTASGAGANNSALHAIIGNAPVDASDIINGLEVSGIAQTVASTTENLIRLTPASSGNTAGTLVGLAIDGITTPNSATENAISIGANWDNLISNTNFTVAGTGNISTNGTLTFASNAITTDITLQNSATIDNDTSGQIRLGSAVPVVDATKSSVLIGSTAIATGNNTTNGGTYLGINAASNFVGDFLNFESNNALLLQATASGTGDITLALGGPSSNCNSTALCLDTSDNSISGGSNLTLIAHGISGGLHLESNSTNVLIDASGGHTATTLTTSGFISQDLSVSNHVANQTITGNITNVTAGGNAVTQTGALIGYNLDLSSGFTVPNSASGNQTAISLTLKDGGVSATSKGIVLNGTVDTGIDLSTLTTINSEGLKLSSFSAITGGGLANCSGTTDKLTYVSATKLFGCGTDQNSGSSISLQTAYNQGSAGDQVIALNNTNNSLIFRNPASSGSASAFLLKLDQLAASGVDALSISQAGSGKAISIASGDLATAGNIAQSGATTFSTGTGTVSLNGDTTIATTKSILFAASSSGNFDQSTSTGTFKTGTGAVSLNGDTTIAANKNLTLAAGTGVVTLNSSVTTNSNVLSIVPSFTSTTTGQIYNLVNLAAFTASNTTGTDTVNGVSIGNLSKAGGGTINSSAINIGTGWDNLISSTNFTVSGAGVVTLAGGQTIDVTTTAGASPTALIFQPGNNTGASSTGANFTLQAGNSSGATSSTGGLLTLKGGNATGGSQTAGGVTIDSGTGTTGGAISIGTSNAASLSLGKAAATFALASSGLNVSTAGALTGVASIDTIGTTTTTLTFTGAGTITANSTSLNLQNDGSVDVNIAGGSGATGCTVTNSSGALACTGNITGSSTGTIGYWSRSGTTLSPATSNDVVTIGTVPVGSSGLAITTANVTSGTTNALSLTTGTLTTAGTQNAINISGGSAGSSTILNGLNIGTASGASTSKTAINIGSGWDKSISAILGTSGQALVIDGATNVNTSTSGIIQLSSKSLTNGNSGIAQTYEITDTASASTQVGYDLTLKNSDTSDTPLDKRIGIRITNASTGNVSSGLYLLALDNADSTASSVANGIVFTSSGSVANATYQNGINFSAIQKFGTAAINFASSGGVLINNSYTSNVNQGSSFTGINFDFTTNFTPLIGSNNKNITGYSFTSPAVTENTTGAFNHTYSAINATGGAFATGGSTTGSLTWNGASFTLPTITQVAGSNVVANGTNIIIPTGAGSITTGGILNGVEIGGSANGALTLGPSAGILNLIKLNDITTTSAGGITNGISIGSITTSGGTDTAVNIGTGWDNLINSTVFSVAGTGVTTITASNATGTSLSVTNSSLTQGTGLSIGATSATVGLGGSPNGSFINISGPNSGSTFTGSGVKITSNVGSSSANTGGLLYLVPNFTGASGTGYGFRVSPSDNTTSSGGYNIIDIAPFNANTSTGTKNAINIDALGTQNASATENAINIGTGWDNGVNIAGTSSLTTQNAINISGYSYNNSSASTSNLITLAYTDAYTNSVGASTVNGINLSPTLTFAGSSPAVTGLNGVNVSPTLSGSGTACPAGISVCSVNDFNAVFSAGNNAANITQNGLSISSSSGFGPSAGTVNGVNINSITASTGTANAVNIGSGWNTGIKISDILAAGKGIDIATSLLNTGTALNIASTSTNQSSANLINGNFTATYSTATPGPITGDLLNLNRNLTGESIAIGNTPVKVDTTSSGSASVSVSYTIATGSNRILLVGISQAANSAITSVTYNGLAMTTVKDSIGNPCNSLSFNQGVSLYYMTNNTSPALPNDGAAHNVSVTWGGSQVAVVGAVSYSGVNQNTPLGFCVPTNGTNNAPTVSVSSVPGDIVLDTMGAFGGAPLTPTVDPSQNPPKWLTNLPAGFGGPMSGGGSTKTATSASTTMSWTITPTPTTWRTLAVSIKPTYNVTGALASLSDSCSGCTNSSNLLLLNQSYSSASGDVLKVVNSGTGFAANLGGDVLLGGGNASFTGGQSLLQVIGNTNNLGGACPPSGFGGCSAIYLSPTINVDSPSGFASSLATSLTVSDSTAGAISLQTGVGIHINNATVGTADSITTDIGLQIDNQTTGTTTNYGILISGASTAGINLSSVNLGSTGLLGTLASSNTGTTTGVGITTGTITSGTQNAFLATLTPTTAGAVNGLNIGFAGGTFGASATVNGINIQTITATSGNKSAINIGSGWDTEIQFGRNNPIFTFPSGIGTAQLDLAKSGIGATAQFRVPTNGGIDTTAATGTLNIGQTGLGAGNTTILNLMNFDNGSTSNTIKIGTGATGTARGITIGDNLPIAADADGTTTSLAGVGAGSNIDFGTYFQVLGSGGVETRASGAGFDTTTGAGVGTLSIGVTNATGISLSNSSSTTTINGNLTLVNGKTLDLASSTAGNTFILKVPTNSVGQGTCVSGQAEGVIFQNTGGTQLGRLACVANGTTQLTMFAQAFTGASTDVAENYSDIANNLQPGDLVSLDPSGPTKGVRKTASANDNLVLGVVSTSPGVLLSDISDSTGATDLVNPIPVALSGRVPTKVSTENGPISVGDSLTTSSTPGVAMKQTQAGPSIGKSLENYSDSTSVGKILVFVHNGYWAPPLTDIQNPVNVTFANITSTNISAETIVLGSNITLDKSGKLTLNGQLIVTGMIKLTGDLTITGNIDATSVAANEFKVKTLTNDPAATAGVATLGAGTSELVINTTKVDTNSLIFVTPTKTTDQQLAVVEKISGTSFKVKLNANATSDITFNWIIINQQISQGN